MEDRSFNSILRDTIWDSLCLVLIWVETFKPAQYEDRFMTASEWLEESSCRWKQRQVSFQLQNPLSLNVASAFFENPSRPNCLIILHRWQRTQPVVWFQSNHFQRWYQDTWKDLFCDLSRTLFQLADMAHFVRSQEWLYLQFLQYHPSDHRWSLRMTTISWRFAFHCLSFVWSVYCNSIWK